MSPRLKFRAAATPLVMAGALWGAGALSSAALGGGAQTPPPCGPDGVCLPKVETYGVYQTRWRTFPGDVITRKPTPTEQEKTEAAVQQQLGGPKLPEASQEGEIGSQRRRSGAERGGAGAVEPGAEGAEPGVEPGVEPGAGSAFPGLPPLPSQSAPGGAAPPAEAPGEVPPAGGPLPDLSPQPGGEPQRDPLDPFGGGPPQPPEWLRRAAAQGAVTSAPAPRVAPAASAARQPAPAIAAPATFQNRPQTTDAPNLRSDDAPPMLPSSLRALSSAGVDHAWNAAAPVVTLPPVVAAAPATQNDVEPIFASDASPASPASPVQPASVAHPIDRRVQPASAEEPQGIQLINPAAAVVVDPGEDGLQQAIYFEASDLDAP